MRRETLILAAACAASTSVLSNSVRAATAYTWSAGPGTQVWSTGWSPAGYPSAQSDTGTIPDLAAALNINVDVLNAEFGSLSFGSTGANTDIGNGNATGNSILLDNAGTVSITSLGTGVNTISAPLILNSGTLELNAASTDNLIISGSVTANGAARTINNNSLAKTLTLNGTLFTDEVGATAARGLIFDANGTAATTQTGTLILNGALSTNGVSASLGASTFGTINNNTNGYVRPVIIVNGNSSGYAGNVALGRVVIVVGNNSAFGTGRLLISGGSTSVGVVLQSDDDSRIISNQQVQAQQYGVVSGAHSLTFTGSYFQSTGRGIDNLLPDGKTLTLANIFTANDATSRAFILDGSGHTVVSGGLFNNFDPTAGTISTSVAAGTFEKRGTGVVTVGGAAIYTGATRVRGGLMEFNNAAAYSTTSGITVDAGGAVGLLTGSTDSAFLTKLAIGGGSSYNVLTGTSSVASNDVSSSGALALAPADASVALNYGSGGNLAAANLQTLGIGAVSTGATYNGTITPAASTYRLGGGGTLTLGNPSGNQLTGANSVVANNGGTVVLTGTNNYTGLTRIGGVYINPSQEIGRLGNQVSILTTPVSLRENSTVAVTTLDNGGAVSSIGSTSNAAANLVLNGGTLSYIGSGSSTDRLFTIESNGATLDGSGTGSVAFTNSGAVVMSDATVASATVDSTARVLDVADIRGLTVGMTVTGTGVAANTTIAALVTPSFGQVGGTGSNGPFQIVLSTAVTAATDPVGTVLTDLAFGNQNRSVNLTGSNAAANTIMPSIGNSTTGVVTVNKSGTGKWVLGGNNTYTGGTKITGGTLGVGSPTALGTGTINVSAGTLQLVQAPGTAFKTTTSALSVSGTGKIDLTNNALVLENTTSSTTLLADTKANILAGTYTTSSTGVNTALGYGDNAVLGKTTFGGQTVDASSILVKYTYKGDLNLDGTVNIADLGTLATNYGLSGKTWTDGDFNGDGVVNIADLGALATSYGQSNPTGVSFTQALQEVGLGYLANQVPEPGTLSLLGVAGLASLRRRRK